MDRDRHHEPNRDRDRSERDPENWRARTDSTSDSKYGSNFDIRVKDEAYRKTEVPQDVRKESGDTPKCPSIGGILVLPRDMDARDMKTYSSTHHEAAHIVTQSSKQLYDPHNPSKPIIVPLAHSRPGMLTQRSMNVLFPEREDPRTVPSGDAGSSSVKPEWYDPRSEW